MSKKKKIVLSLVALFVVVAAAVGAAAYFKVGPFTEPKKDGSVNLDAPTKDQVKTGQSAKDATVNNGKPGENTGGSDPSPAPTPSPDGGKASVGADITAANQDGAVLHIRALIQTITSSGTCTLTMAGPNGKSYTQQAGVQALPSTSTCKGFDVGADQLSPGAWTVQVAFENDDVTATTTKQIEIQ